MVTGAFLTQGHPSLGQGLRLWLRKGLTPTGWQGHNHAFPSSLLCRNEWKPLDGQAEPRAQPVTMEGFLWLMLPRLVGAVVDNFIKMAEIIPLLYLQSWVGLPPLTVCLATWLTLANGMIVSVASMNLRNAKHGGLPSHAGFGWYVVQSLLLPQSRAGTHHHSQKWRHHGPTGLQPIY